MPRRSTPPPPRPRRSAGRVAAVAGGAIATVAVVALSATLVLSGGDLGYAFRVLSHGDASTEDDRWKAAIEIGASAPAVWADADRCDEVRDATESVVGLPLDQWLEVGGGTQFVVVRDGRLWCSTGPERGEAQPVFSISKSVLGVLVARAEASGRLDGHAALGDLVAGLGERDPRLAAITIDQLLDMRSGIAFDAEVGFPWLDQDGARVYYASDLRQTVLTAPRVESDPGPFVYNDYAPNLVGLAYERGHDATIVADGLPELWSELGSEQPARWSVDEKGFPWHESGMIATATDLARVGATLLADDADAAPGLADHLRLAARGPLAAEFAGVPLRYAQGWWILAEDGEPRYAALGRFGQVMLVSPSTGTVIVRLGADGFEAVQSNASLLACLDALADELADTPPRSSCAAPSDGASASEG